MRKTVLLDGKPVDHVISYDVEEGVVTRYQTDAHGNFVMKGGLAQTEQLRGTIFVREEPRPGLHTR